MCGLTPQRCSNRHDVLCHVALMIAQSETIIFCVIIFDQRLKFLCDLPNAENGNRRSGVISLLVTYLLHCSVADQLTLPKEKKGKEGEKNELERLCQSQADRGLPFFFGKSKADIYFRYISKLISRRRPKSVSLSVYFLLLGELSNSRRLSTRRLRYSRPIDQTTQGMNIKE